MLTRKQHELIRFIQVKLEETGVSPSFEEMKEALDLKSKSGVHRLISALEERGFIRRLPNRARALEVLRQPEDVGTKAPPRAANVNSAAAVVRCLESTQPRVFTLENVGAYQHGKAYRLICQALDRGGYMWHAEVLNSADFGVPQTRRRLILRAVRDALLPSLPEPTRWVGWYAAIEDLIPTLPESQFAPWQLSRLAAAFDKGQELSQNIFVGGANKSQSFLDFAVENRPTIPGIRNENEPIMLVPADAATNQAGRAFIVSNAATMDMRDAGEPMVTVTATTHSKAAMLRAFLVSGGNSYTPILSGDAPSVKLGASPSTATGHRAWLVSNNQQEYSDGLRRDDEPSHSVTLQSGGRYRAWLQTGRVVKMTPRALARFQSFPDSYVLPDRASLACTIIGNAVPSLMMRRIVEQLI